MPAIEINRSGPIFDGRAMKAAADASKDIEKDVAEVGAMLVRANLNTVLRHQTPHYRLQVEARRDPLGWKVSDGGVIYSAWLEGVGSRNKTTRFKGYFTFRRTTQELKSRANAIANGTLRRYLSRMQ